ncbi:MAG: 4Fe-4S dicluster domain-containing protein [candidate division Zixibacteria bacterium]|nr:4Fe-4S dicluster domain-containing protein [candidate division Zixibacteria bacterium]
MKKKKSNPLSRREFLMICSKALPFTGIFFIPFTADQILFAQKTKEYDPTQHEYAMGINIHKCIGCGRCADACKKENNVPREPYYFRTWVERYIISTDGETYVDSPNGGIDGFPEFKDNLEILRTFFVPKLCNQCANPPCVQVCPVGATFLSRDGVVLVDEKYCVGCRYCIQACPYGARFLHPTKKIADKCTFCYHRLVRGLLPVCVEVCPTQARVFGEVGLQSSPLRRFLRFNDVVVLKPSLNTRPKVYYAGADGEVR